MCNIQMDHQPNWLITEDSWWCRQCFPSWTKSNTCHVITPYRVPAGRLITMCSGTTTTSLQMNCRSSPTSYATPMCAAPGQFPSQHQLTMPIWWLSGLAITWWTKSMTGKDWAVCCHFFEQLCVHVFLWIKPNEIFINLLMLPFQCRGQPYIRTE